MGIHAICHICSSDNIFTLIFSCDSSSTPGPLSVIKWVVVSNYRSFEACELVALHKFVKFLHMKSFFLHRQCLQRLRQISCRCVCTRNTLSEATLWSLAVLLGIRDFELNDY